jgi:hypothetical protein
MDNNVMLENKRFLFRMFRKNNLHSVKQTSHVVDEHSQGPNEHVSSCPKNENNVYQDYLEFS